MQAISHIIGIHGKIHFGSTFGAYMGFFPIIHINVTAINGSCENDRGNVTHFTLEYFIDLGQSFNRVVHGILVAMLVKLNLNSCSDIFHCHFLVVGYIDIYGNDPETGKRKKIKKSATLIRITAIYSIEGEQLKKEKINKGNAPNS
jgi:hypothetical protein